MAISTVETANPANVSKLAFEDKDNPTQMITLLEAVRRLVKLWAYRYNLFNNQGSRLFDKDDLMQAGYLDLVDAVVAYHEGAEVEFTTYLRRYVQTHFAIVAGRRGTKKRQEIIAGSLDLPMADGEGDSLIQFIPDKTAEADFEATEEDVYNGQLIVALDAAMEYIPQEKAEILRQIYYKNITCSEGAQFAGVAYSMYNKRIQDGLRAMRRGKARVILKPYEDDIIHTTYRGTLKRVKHTWTSPTERAVLRMEEQKRGSGFNFSLMADVDALIKKYCG